MLMVDVFMDGVGFLIVCLDDGGVGSKTCCLILLGASVLID